jgi:FG-GAP-like repeat
MRSFRLLFVALVSLIGGAVPAVASPTHLAAFLVQPFRADFDRDGHPDVASVDPLSNPSALRIRLSSSGVREIAQSSAVSAIAGVDFDRDGDIDLLVGTAEGALVWLNDGLGAFMSEPIHFAAVPDDSARMTSVVVSSATSVDREDPATIDWDPAQQVSTRVDRPIRHGACSALPRFTSASSPRAPPAPLP